MEAKAIVRFQAGSLNGVSRLKKFGSDVQYYITAKRGEGAWIATAIEGVISTSIQFSSEADAETSCVISEHGLDTMCKLDRLLPKGADVRMEISEDKIVEYSGSGRYEVACELCEEGGIERCDWEGAARFTISGESFTQILKNAVKMYKKSKTLDCLSLMYLSFREAGRVSIFAGCGRWIMRYDSEARFKEPCTISIEYNVLSLLSALVFNGVELSVSVTRSGTRGFMAIEDDGMTVRVFCNIESVKPVEKYYKATKRLHSCKFACVKVRTLKKALGSGAGLAHLCFGDGGLRAVRFYFNDMQQEPQRVNSVDVKSEEVNCEFDVWLYCKSFVKALDAYKSSDMLRISLVEGDDVLLVVITADDKLFTVVPEQSWASPVRKLQDSGKVIAQA